MICLRFTLRFQRLVEPARGTSYNPFQHLIVHRPNNFCTTTTFRMSQVVHTDSFIHSHYDPAVKKLKVSLDLAKETGASAKVIESIEESLKLFQQRDEYAEDLTSVHSKTCAGIVQETVTHDWQKAFEEKKTTWNLNPMMMSGHLEGQFLKSFVSAQKAKRVLDIGMYTGYSAVSIAEALPADGEIVTLEIQEYLKPVVENLIKDSPHKNKIRIVIGKAIDTMTTMKNNGEKFDAVFMDAAKSEYFDYLKICLEDNLLAPGGTVIIDNAFMHGQAYTNPDSNPAKFGKFLKSKTDVHVVFVPVRDGIYLVRRRSDVDGGVL